MRDHPQTPKEVGTPCKWCSKLTRAEVLRECNNCWELRTRMEMDVYLAQKILNAVIAERAGR